MNRSIPLSLIALFLTTFAFAEEGMWEILNLPPQVTQNIQNTYGFDVTTDWQNDVMMSSVRFPQGSGSFISSTGLVMTNHHVATDALQNVSTPEHDYIKTGFLARTQAEEIRTVDMKLNQLREVTDVTGQVLTANPPSSTTREQRDNAISSIQERCNPSNDPAVKCEVVELYKGFQYHLYKYKVYSDVRVVFAPEFDIAFFGGDPDNFEYPRYDLDIAIFRVYENGQPAHIDHYFRWSQNGAAANELVFVSGHPGSTNRILTADSLETMRDTRIPGVIDYLQRLERTALDYGNLGAEQQRQAHETLFGVQNSLKAYRGEMRGFKNPALIEGKREIDNNMRNFALNNRSLQGYAQAWDRIDQAQNAFRDMYAGLYTWERGRAFGTVLFGIARNLVRLAQESTLPNNSRLPEYRDEARANLEQGLYSEAPIYDEWEIAQLTTSLTYMVDKVGASNPLVKQVLAGRSPSERAVELIRGTTLKDVATRRRIAAGGLAAINNSTDPMILVAKMVDAEARRLRTENERNVADVEREAYGQIAEVKYVMEGTSAYPDATFTLRLTYGTVKGYEQDGQTIPPWTTIGGAFQHEQEHGAIAPYRLPDSWTSRRATLDESTPFNFVADVDIIGGNSGSPVINQNKEIVGLIFDGNAQSLVADYIYDGSENRAVAVHSSGIMEALRKIYDANELVNEIGR